jgi:hypothetical protein
MLFLFLGPAGNANAIQASQNDFSTDAFVESFEGLSEGVNIVRLSQSGPGPMSMSTPMLIPWYQLGTQEPLAFVSGVTMLIPYDKDDTTDAALVGDFALGPAFTTMLESTGRKPLSESVDSESDVPDGRAYMTLNGVSDPYGVVFAFGADMFRVGACVTSDSSSPGWITLVAYDANGAEIESHQIDAVDIADWGTNFLGVEAEGIRKVAFLGDYVLLDKLMFEAKPEEDVPQASNAVIFATNSVWLLRGAKIHKGDIVVKGDQEDCSSYPPYLNSDCQVSIGKYAYLKDDSAICADSIKLKRKASVGDIKCNYLVNRRGTVRGEQSEFECPEIRLPESPDPTPGDEYIRIKRGRTLTLRPGAYGEIRMQKRSKLILTGGEYHLENLKVGRGCKVFFQGPTDLVINNRLRPGSWAYIGPDCKAKKEGLSAKDVRIFVHGTNGNTANIDDKPRAAVIGRGNRVRACIYAPNGTLWIKLYSKAEGAFYGREVRIGIRTKVSLENGF